jgi:putative endonuclease
MKNPALIGRWGEKIAGQYLKKMGYRILHQNWRSGKFEVDLIVMDGDETVFVEVKCRSGLSWGTPSRALDKRKRGSIAAAASLYIEGMKEDLPIRFDLVEIIAPEKMPPVIRHYKDVFFP